MDQNLQRPRVGHRISFRWGMLGVGLAVIGLTWAIRLFSGSETAEAQSARSPVGARPAAQAQPVAPLPSTPVATARNESAGRSANQPSVASPGENSASAGSTARGSAGPATQAVPQKPVPKIVAQVNGITIGRDELAEECLRRHGKEMLESMVNKHLIAEECKRRNIVITREEVDAEIERMAQRFNLPVEQWLKLLKQERGINPVQYASDIIWPTLALRRLAGERLAVSPAEIRAAWEAHYGESIKCRLIAVRDRARAEQIRAEAAEHPDQFGDLAKQHSEDSSASVKGVIPPIRRHGSFPEIERVAFEELRDGEVSRVLQVGDQFLILKRECKLPASQVAVDRVAPQLEEIVRERKMRTVAAEIFQQLQQQARVENVFNDPAKRRAMPGVAATINGRPIPLSELADHCVERYGEEVLEGLINRKLIEQACKKRNIAVSDAEMDAEIARTAAEMVPLKPDGSPDVDTWLKTVVEEQRTTVEIYRCDAVWPAVALKKLAADGVKVTEEDLQKGYEANFGPRVRCRAIVLNNPRRAQEVWEMARRRPNAEYFGQLAETYSVEPGSQALRGEVPPIRKHGGQPLLEKAAFALKPGELSEIIQVGDKWVILFCEGYTQPIDVDFARVRDDIYRDIYEKKLRLAMYEYFEHLRDSATIDNYLAGTSSTPAKRNATARTDAAVGAAEGARHATLPLKMR